MENRNIYAELALIPSEIADKITNSKTGGGRSLNAIHKSKNLNSTEKHLLLVIANEMDFRKDFEYQYQYISLNQIAELMSVNKSTVSRTLNGHKTKQREIPGLIERGYVLKKIASIESQQVGDSNHYCLTSKIFNEYMFSMMEKKMEWHHATGGSGIVRQGVVAQCDRGSGTVRHNIPSDLLNIPLNAAAQKTPAVKRVRPKNKMKIWADKSESEKMDTVLNLAVEAHRTAIVQKRSKPYPFEDFPDLLKPILEKYGVEKVKEFFEAIKSEGCDVRKLTKTMDEFVSPVISTEPESLQEKDFPEKIVDQMETNSMYIKIEPVKSHEVKIDNFPIRLRKFYDSLNPMRKKGIIKEVVMIGIDNFIKLRAPAILKCSYEDLFVEQSVQSSFF